jgi:hypothetical protein
MSNDEFWNELLGLKIFCVACALRTTHLPSPLPTLSPYKDYNRYDCSRCNCRWVLVKGEEVLHQESGWKHDLDFGAALELPQE